MSIAHRDEVNRDLLEFADAIAQNRGFEQTQA